MNIYIKASFSVSQAVEKLTKKVLEILNEISSFDDSCHRVLITMVEAFPVKDFVNNIVTRVLSACTKLSQKKESSELCESGTLHLNPHSLKADADVHANVIMIIWVIACRSLVMKNIGWAIKLIKR
ncbi:hypothetical protein ACLOJK_038992 [Asimina triloba]